jgi:cytidylate kinase
MAIITISRELAALGDEIGTELARVLRYRLINKQVLEERIKLCGVAEHSLQKYDERKPSFFASLSQDRDDYLHHLKTAFFTEAETGNVIFMGRGAVEIFKYIPGVISVYLSAPFAIRIERVKSYFNCDEKKAQQIIEQSDQDQAGFRRYFFDTDWKDPDNYHVVLNTGYLHPAVCSGVIKNILDNTVSAETEAQSSVRLKEVVLGHQIKHYILYEKELPIHFLEVSVSDGQVTLYGVANSKPLADLALNMAHEIHGTVGSEIQVVQEYNTIP